MLSALCRDLTSSGCPWRRTFYLVSTKWQQGGHGEITESDCQEEKDSSAPPCASRHKPPLAVSRDQESVKEKSTRRNELKLLRQLRIDKNTKKFAKEHLIASKIMYRHLMKSFSEHVTSQVSAENSELSRTVRSILDGNADKNVLLPHFLSHARSIEPLIGPVEHLLATSNLTSPPSWFPEARASPRKVVYHVGPTNSGKTHAALQKFKTARAAIYCAPLRLLAHEIFHRSNSEGAECDLLTGEESQFSSGDKLRPASRLACTVEMAFSNSCDSRYDVAIIDEIQMIADLERGGAWTRALLGIPADEVHLCGHECVIDLIERIAATTGDTVEVHHYERLSPLVLSKKTLKGSYENVEPGDCVVVFSRNEVFEVSQLIEKETKQKCALIYGSLPPAVRVKQADMFNDLTSDCNVMVATDAVGMGLNLNIGRIVFDSLKKYNGKRRRNLTPAHARQIAGRAGRYGKKRSEGRVTTFEEKNFKLLETLLKSDIRDTERAGLYPSVEQIKLFASFIPKAKLYEILTLFGRMAELDGIYFLCDFSKQIDLAYELKEVEMSLEDMFLFTLAPVDADKKKTVATFIEFAKCFSEGREICVEALFDHLGSPPTVARSSSNLAQLELKYEVVKLYRWLSMRYPEIFVDGEEAQSLHDAIEECIDESLVLKSAQYRHKARRVHSSRSRRHVFS